MRTVTFIFTLLPVTSSFVPLAKPQHSRLLALHATRRQVATEAIASFAFLAATQAAEAKPASTFFFDEKIETVHEPSQMPTNGKFDLNAAFVVRTQPRKELFHDYRHR